MDVTTRGYLALLILVGVVRLLEVRLSRRNQRALLAKGAAKVPEPAFRWMVLFHGGVLIAAAAEVLLLHRPFVPVLATAMGIVFVLANLLRWWVIRVLAEHWNVQVMKSVELSVVTAGPFRWIRHPNYAAVFMELIALPLIHSAWVTASAGAIIHVAILRQRLTVEEAMLHSNPLYVAAMGSKPRFVPRLTPTSAKSARLGRST
jgi:methyltransferase